MRKFTTLCFIFFLTKFSLSTASNPGDTLIVRAFDHFLHVNCNTGDTTVLFPPDTAQYYKVMLHYQITCPSIGCDIYDRKANLRLMVPNGIDSTGNIIYEEFEVVRGITSYGMATDWWFDISDFTSLLHDSLKFRSNICGYSNGWEVTTDFVFIYGVPIRDAYKVENLWNGTWAYGNVSDPIENHLPPITVVLDSASQSSKVRITTTGHGGGCPPDPNAAEFTNFTHQVIINQDTIPQNLWRSDCGQNPLFPQGAPGGYYSTWYLNRANWCPGNEVFPYEYSLDNYGNAGDSVVLNYDMYPFQVTGTCSYAPEYFIHSQIVSYGAINYNNNVSLEEILIPNGDFPSNRLNPVCLTVPPKILIKNNGANAVTTMSIEYSIDGNIPSVLPWTGNILFGDSAYITFPLISYGAGSHTFSVNVVNVNGVTDEFVFDNSLQSLFNATHVYTDNFIRVYLKTDQYPAESSWDLRDDQGTVLYSRSNLVSASTLFLDTVYLPTGCYTINVYDSFGDGVCCFAGQGLFRVLPGSSVSPANAIMYSGDFGDFYSESFSMDNTVGFSKNEALQFSLFPNPVKNELHINTNVIEGEVLVFDEAGRIQKVNTIWNGNSISMNVSSLDNGVYFIQLKSEAGMSVRKFMKAN